VGRFLRPGGAVSIILTVLSWILVLLLAVYYFRILMQGRFWLD